MKFDILPAAECDEVLRGGMVRRTNSGKGADFWTNWKRLIELSRTCLQHVLAHSPGFGTMSIDSELIGRFEYTVYLRFRDGQILIVAIVASWSPTLLLDPPTEASITNAAPPRSFDAFALRRPRACGSVARRGISHRRAQEPVQGSSVEFAEHGQYYLGDESATSTGACTAKRTAITSRSTRRRRIFRRICRSTPAAAWPTGGERRASSITPSHVAACLAYLMLHQLDAVGLVTMDAKLRSYLPPRANAKHLLRILRVLEQTNPGGETALAPLWHELAAHQIRRRGLVIILSDCFDDLHNLSLALKHFRHKNTRCCCFTCSRRRRSSFRFIGPRSSTIWKR